MKKKSTPIGIDKGLPNLTLSERFARLAELEAAIEKERAAIAKQREADLISLWKAFVDHVESAGSSVEEVMRLGGFKLRRSGAATHAAVLPGNKQKVEAVYVNPADPSQTWSGRGRKARWLADALAADPRKLLTDFLAPSKKVEKAG